jgi:hypothetical protein
MRGLNCVSSDATPDRRKGPAAGDTQFKSPRTPKPKERIVKRAKVMRGLNCVSSAATPDRRKGPAAGDTQFKSPRTPKPKEGQRYAPAEKNDRPGIGLAAPRRGAPFGDGGAQAGQMRGRPLSPNP